MNVLSLFDGMSCGQIALKELGIKVEKYYASEIDKYAIAQTKLNFPNTIHLGSVVDVDVSQLEPIDLLIGGSPCQSFSFAGKRKGMATKCEIEITKLEQYLELKEQGFEFEGQSYLFWEYMRILTDIRQYNPDVIFLLENVEMGSKWEQVLSEAIGIFGVHINSALVSAQNRKRIYWTNIKTRTEGLFGEIYSDIPQPEDRGILLRDILEENVDEKYFLSDKMLKYFDKRTANFNNGLVNIRNKEEKETTLCASMASCDISDNFVIDTHGRIDDKKTGPILARYGKGATNFGSDPFILNTKMKIKPDQDKSGTFTAGGNSGGLHSDMDLICVAMRGRDGVQQLEPNNEGKTNCITSVQKDNLVVTSNYIQLTGTSFDSDNRFWFENGKHAACVTRGFYKTGVCIEQRERGFNKGASFYEKSPTLSANSWEHNNTLNQNMFLRRLTPTECTRLQTIPSWYIWECSETQQYKLLGNGWNVETVKHIFKFMK